jgi:2-polyprenyl-3-methyl-5-hydroxy-6-metoxy-1,4-benzoquinol methylase
VVPERLEERLARLEEERSEADRIYNERLTAVDRALLRAPEFPHAPPAYDETQITPINQAWTILPEAPPVADGSLKGRLRGFIWRLVGPPLSAQQTFNAAVVDHLNRNVAAHRETERALASTIALLRQQTESMLHHQAAMMSLLQSLTLFVDTKDRTVGGQVQVLNAALSALSDDWMKHWESQQVRESRLATQQPALLRAYDELSDRVSLAQQTAVLLKREVERLIAAPPGSVDASAASLDSFKYVGFEDRFRGSQDRIRAQLADYVPLFAGASRVIDIGCGRGELLDLLREAGIGAHGVDVNASMVEICRERGLSADVAGAVEYLEQQPDDSLDGLIAIQVVEHLEPSYLTRLLDVAFSKLKAGAPLVLETLNPACWVAFFESYIRDVTHRWPLHPDTLHYLAQASGFSSVTVQFRAPVAEADRLEHVPALRTEEGRAHDPVVADLVDVVNAHADKLNARLFTHMDYAVVARK